jgi:hypothetical protein
MKVAGLSAIGTGRLYHPPPRRYSWYPFLFEGAAGRIISVKNSRDTIGNRTRDLPICSAVPQPTTPPRTHWANDNGAGKHNIDIIIIIIITIIIIIIIIIIC